METMRGTLCLDKVVEYDSISISNDPEEQWFFHPLYQRLRMINR